MLKFSSFFFFCGCFFLCCGALAEEPASQVIVDIQPEEEAPAVNLHDWFEDYKSEVDYFDGRLPELKAEDDFSEDVLLRHPELSDEEAASRETLLRYGIRAKRLYKFARGKIEDFLLENDLPIRFEEEKMLPRYQENGSDALIIQDFETKDDAAKTALSPEAETGEDTDASSPQNRRRLKKALLQGDWKSVFSYGLFDGKPLEDKRGVGEWTSDAGIKGRLLLSRCSLGEDKTISGALQLAIPSDSVLLGRPYKDYPGLRLVFDAWAGLNKITPHLPLPQRRSFDDGSSLAGYVGNLIVPLDFELNSTSDDLALNAEVSGVLCNQDSCNPFRLRPRLILRPGAGGESSVAAFLRQAQRYAPHDSEELQLERIVVETSSDPRVAQLIRVELAADTSPQDVDVYLDDDRGTSFTAPLLSMDGSRITARFKSTVDGLDFIGRPLTVSARIKPDVSIRQQMIAEPAPLLDISSGKLSWGMVGLAVLGGFLLNFMPCVFPVLSLKILSFMEFGGLNLPRIRRGFAFNLLGLAFSFGLIILLLLLLKWSGRAVGWGMQFQNVWFLSLMIFVITVFLAHLSGVINLKSPHFVETVLQKPRSDSKLLHFLTGVFLVLLATPCTAPYLGTALGFALAGSGLDIAVIVSAVGAGLALPYLLFALMPSLVYYVPRPGRWMRRLNLIMALLLGLTLVWLLTVLAAQTSPRIVMWFGGYLAAFWGILVLRRALFNALDARRDVDDVRGAVKHILNLGSMILLAVVILAAGMTADAAYRRRRLENSRASINTFLSSKDIKDILDGGNVLLVKVGADWCLTCKYNDVTVFDTVTARELYEKYNIVTINVDWTGYDAEVLAFMEKFGRRGLPFYVVFSARVPEGMVLPEIVGEQQFREILETVRY